MNKFAKALVATVIAIAGVFPAQVAFAHAELESSNPEANSVIGSAPEVISLTFGEKLMVLEGEVAANQVQVEDSMKVRVDNGDFQVNGNVLTVSLKPGLPDDAYTITYRVVSADGHPIEGLVDFEVSAAARSGEATPMPISEQPEATLYEAPAEEEQPANGLAIGVGVLVGAVVVAGAMFFVFRRFKADKKS
jgi:methionine-rich copper-binding protein CopC